MAGELTKEEILSLSHKAVDYALSKNVDAAEVFSQLFAQTQVMTEGISIANERDKRELGFAVRVIKVSQKDFHIATKQILIH